MKSIIIYGVGMRGKSLLSLFRNTEINIDAVVDSNPVNWGKRIEGVLVTPPDSVCMHKSTPICIAMGNVQEKVKIRKEIKNKYGFCGEEYDYFDLVYGAYTEIVKEFSLVAQSITQDETKILFDCHKGLVMGGIELWTKQLCVELLDRGWNQLHIICDAQDYNEPRKIMDIVDQVNIDNEKTFGKETFLNVIQYLHMRMPFTVITSFPDVILMAACILKKIYPEQVHIISVIHHGECEHYDVNIKFKNEVDVYVGVSEEIKQEMLKRGADIHRVFSMTCPVKCEEELKRTYSVSYDEPIHIGYAGRLITYKKRVDLLLEMIKELEKLGVNYKFEIAGDGPDRKLMDQFVKQNVLGDKIIFRGAIAREQIDDFWKTKDICVNISDCEGRCISKMEGMAGGAVPIVTDVAGTREDIVDGENGYIVPVEGYAAMAESIYYLSVHRELLAEMGRKAHNAILSKSKMSEHINFWEKVLNMCRSGKGRDVWQ